MLSHKRGKFVEKLYGKFSSTFNKTKQAMDQAVAKKYAAFLSRRKFNFLCKVQSSTFNMDDNKWCNKTISYGDQKINLREKSISDCTVSKFVYKLVIYMIYLDFVVTCTVTALVTMIIDLHLPVPTLYEKLTWFNDVEYHFIFELSDDGASESKDNTMRIDSITLWNIGSKVHSREYQYILHTISCGEKEAVLGDLWRQHTDEMLLLEGSMLNIRGKSITLQFQRSADQAWQFWANNELTQSATYPSMYAKVHKSELTLVGHAIGDKWEIATMESRKQDIIKLAEFSSTLNPNLSNETVHKKKLAFMANNGLRRLGEPRINLFADRQIQISCTLK